MNRKRWGRFVGGLLGVVALVVCVWLLLPAGQVQSGKLRQDNLPWEGWQVCEYLADVQLPGGGFAQSFKLCSSEGWEVQAYCIDLGATPPPEGRMCSRLDDTLFWCGDDVQRLNLYQILQTAPPTETSLPPRPTFTHTPTLTATFTVTVTTTATTTATAIPPAEVITPSQSPLPPTETEIPPDTDTSPTLTPTVYHRPPPGGPGNLVPVLSVLGLTAGLGLLAAAWLTGRRR